MGWLEYLASDLIIKMEGGVWLHQPPPTTTTHPQWWSDSRVCPGVVEWTICWQFKSQIRLDKVLLTEIIWVWHFFSPLTSFFVFGADGDFSWTKGRRTSEGEVVADWWCLSQSGQSGETDKTDKNTLGFCLCEPLSVRTAWFFVRFYFLRRRMDFERTELLWGLFFSPLHIAFSTCSHSPHHVSGETGATLVKWKLVVVVRCTPFVT